MLRRPTCRPASLSYQNFETKSLGDLSYRTANVFLQRNQDKHVLHSAMSSSNANVETNVSKLGGSEIFYSRGALSTTSRQFPTNSSLWVARQFFWFLGKRWLKLTRKLSHVDERTIFMFLSFPEYQPHSIAFGSLLPQ